MQQLLNKFRHLVGEDLIYLLILSLLVVILAFTAAKLFSIFIRKILKPIVDRTESNFDNYIVDVFEKTSFHAIVITGFYLALSVFRGGFGLISNYSKKSLVAEYPSLSNWANIIEKILFVLVVLIAVIIAARLVKVVIKWYSERIDAESNLDLSGSLFPLLQKLGVLLLVIIGFVVVSTKFNLDISTLLVSLGFGSLAIALAAQDALSNMISGFIIMLDRPFRIGDRIKVGTDIFGDVVSVGVRSTKILDFDRNLMIIPNNELVKSRIINLTYPTPQVRVLIEFGVVYGTDFEAMKKLVLDHLNSYEIISKDFQPDFVIMKFGESSIDIRLDVKTDHYRNSFDLAVKLREGIYKLFNDNNIEFAFPVRIVKGLHEKAG
ncbi:MAG: mechanosensitive ion channel family protein [Ignavibacteriaceae bacterium]|nr:mechanosensitive ion channel family protein [Ignavibacteriaceae bacterium]